MGISTGLADNFWDIIEIRNVPWSTIDQVACSDANILRPIKGVCFETLFSKLIKKISTSATVRAGVGDSDIDLFINGYELQLKTIDRGSTTNNRTVGVALHKTHGDETRPNNLYSKNKPTFDFLVVFHPNSGILIIPYDEIPENSRWPGYLADPAKFDWNSKWLNRWDLIGFPEFKGVCLDERHPPTESLLPCLSNETYLMDYDIIETLCKPEYFRAAVMGLKGNLKEHWVIENLIKNGYAITRPKESYPKYDFIVTNSKNEKIKVQAKGTSKNMCNSDNYTIGVEVMGTHGQFPERGYKKTYFDYVVIIISRDQIHKKYNIKDGLHFVYISMADLPLHYLINKGDKNKDKGWGNKKWNMPEFNNVVYPNIKLRTKYNKQTGNIELLPDLKSYTTYKGFDTIPKGSIFRNVGPFILDWIPDDFS